MKTPSVSHGAWLGAAAMCFLAANDLSRAQDVGFIAVVKGQGFEQIGPDLVMLKDPTQLGDEEWLGFEAFAQGTAADALVSGTVILPAGAGTVTLLRDAEDPSRLAHEYDEEEFLALNTARPNGVHAVQLVTKNQGTLNVSVNLTGDTYPPVPRVTNHTALQSINPAVATTIQWPAWPGGASNDFIMVSVSDDQGGEVFSTPEPGMPGCLTGTAVSATIPAATLQGSHTYHVELLMVKVVDSKLSPAATIAGYYKITEFTISTGVQAGSALGAQFDGAVPQSGNTDVSRDSKVLFRFSRPMNTGFRSVTWSGSGLNPANFSYQWVDSNRALHCSYTGNLPAGTTIGWQLNLSGFKDAAGVALQGSASGNFFTATAVPTAPVVTGFYFFKTRGYRQSGASPVATGMFGCDPNLELGGYNRITQGTVSVGGSGGSARLRPSEWYPEVELECTYASKSDFDMYFPNGTKTYNVTLPTGTVQPYTLALGAVDDYPAAPTISNLAALQAINPAASVTVSWTAPAGWTNAPAEGTTVSEIDIENNSGNTAFQVDPESMASGSGQTIPAGTLWPGRTYRVVVSFHKIKDLDVTTYPGAFGVGGFSSSTEFTIKTSGSPVMPSVMLERIGGGMQLNLAGGEPEREYVVETSGDMVRWLPQDTRYISSYSMSNDFFDNDSQFIPKRFYRLRDLTADERWPGWISQVYDIQGVVWADASHMVPVAGATVGTTLDGRTVTTDAAGRFFLETATVVNNNNPDSQSYSVRVTVGAQTMTYGTFTGAHPRLQYYEWSTGGYGVSGP